MHTPVLLKPVLEGLGVKDGGIYIDATVGQGGHLKKILAKGGKVLALDLDENQIKKLREQIEDNGLTLVVGNFADIEKIAREQAFFPVDGVLFDLGLSYNQLAELQRGFSYKNHNQPLDMRLSLKSENTAADLINSLSEDTLYEIFAKNSEEINSRAIARAIVSARHLKKLSTVGELTELIDKVIKGKDEKVYARIFQALRMEVNQEINNLKRGLQGALNLIRKDGRIVAITFHSVEDRIVKKFIKEKDLKQIYKLKGDSGYERSATLRVFTKQSNEKNN